MKSCQQKDFLRYHYRYKKYLIVGLSFYKFEFTMAGLRDETILIIVKPICDHLRL